MEKCFTCSIFKHAEDTANLLTELADIERLKGTAIHAPVALSKEREQVRPPTLLTPSLKCLDLSFLLNILLKGISDKVSSLASTNRAFSHDVRAAMLVFQNKGMAAMMVYQTNPLGIELYFYASTFFCFSNPIWLLVT